VVNVNGDIGWNTNNPPWWTWASNGRWAYLGDRVVSATGDVSAIRSDTDPSLGDAEMARIAGFKEL
jgi:hypothetical protein